MLIPILLLVVLAAAVLGARSLRNKGTITPTVYSRLVSGISIVVTVAALAVMFGRLR